MINTPLYFIPKGWRGVKAGGEVGLQGFVMCHALAAVPVSRARHKFVG